VKHKRSVSGECARGTVASVTAIILIGVFAAAIIAFGTVFGGLVVGLILGVVAIVGAFVWFLALGGSKTTARDVARHAPDQEFLGPGAPTTRPKRAWPAWAALGQAF
jgi:hypothetical protein